MDDRDLEARLRTHLHRSLDDAQPSPDLASGIAQVFSTEPRRLGLALPRVRPAARLGWSLGAVVVLLVVMALAASALKLPIGPGSPTQTPTATIPSVGPFEQSFIVLPPTSDLPSKADSNVASDVLEARLRALGIGTFSGAIGYAIQFRILESGHSEDAIRTVLAATGDVAFVPLPAADYGDGGLTAKVGEPLPKAETPLFGWEGIASIDPDTSGSEPAITVTLKPAAAGTFEVFTTQHVGETFAIVLDGSVALLPTIQTSITGGRVTLTSGLDSGTSFATTAAILVGGVLPPAWRGASVPTLITKGHAAELVLRADRTSGASLQSVELNAIQVDSAWRAVWNVVLSGDFPGECPVPASPAVLTDCPSARSMLVVLDAMTGAFISSEAPAP